MATLTFKSEVQWEGEGVLSTAYIGDKQVQIDEPKSLGGFDQAPNPVEYLLAGLGGCINVLVVTYAKQFDVEINDVKVNVEGDLDPDGFLGKNPNVRPGYEEIRYEIVIDSSSDEAKVQALLDHVQKICPVKDTLQGTRVVNVNERTNQHS